MSLWLHPLVFGFSLSFFVLAGCHLRNVPNFNQFQQPLPTKDEVALINGRPITISDYLFIRDTLQSKYSPEVTLWVGLASYVLLQNTLERKIEFSKKQALDIARYSVGDITLKEAANSLRVYFAPKAPELNPAIIKKELDTLIGRAIIIKNPIDLAAF